MGIIGQTFAATTTAATTTAAATEAAEWECVGVIWVVGALGIVSFLFAAPVFGAEIGVYSLVACAVAVADGEGGESGRCCCTEWLERPTYAIEGSGGLQNLAGFGVSAAFTGMLNYYGYPEWAQALISIAVVTPLLLLFSDIVPKDLFHTHTDSLDVSGGATVEGGRSKLITVVPLLPLVNGLSWLSMKMVGSRKEAEKAMGPRSEIVALFQESAATGVLSGTQQDLVQRALRLAADQCARGDDSVESGGGCAGVDFVGGVSGVGEAV